MKSHTSKSRIDHSNGSKIRKEKFRKRRATLVNKIVSLANDCNLDIYLLIQDKTSNKHYEFDTNKGANWRPSRQAHEVLPEPPPKVNLRPLPSSMFNDSYDQLEPPKLGMSPVSERSKSFIEEKSERSVDNIVPVIDTIGFSGGDSKSEED